MKRLALLCAATLFVGCGEDSFLADVFGVDHARRTPRTRTVLQPQAPTRASLLSFTGAQACTDLEAAIENEAVARMIFQVETNRANAHGSAASAWGSNGGTVDAGAMSASGGGSGGGAGGSAPADHTTTNTQVAGIDEADFVKNDGTRIFVLSGNTLRAVRSWPASSLSNAGALTIEGTPREMFLDGDRVLVFSLLSQSQGYDYYYSYSSATHTRATLVDVSNLDQLKVLASWTLSGNYHAARRIGSRVLTVLNSNPYGSYSSYGGAVQTYVSLWRHNGRAVTPAEIDDAYDALLSSNEDALRRRTLSEWLTTGSFNDQRGTVVPEDLDCSKVFVPNGSVQSGEMHLYSLDMNAPAPATRTTVFARADELYMSFDSLYFTQRHWWWSAGGSELTYLHRFNLTDLAAPKYDASGLVKGSLVDQFSMDEHDGDLRIAHTERDSAWRTLNRVSVLRSNAGLLETIGQTEALAPGERIMSARFIGPTAYVVTFRQTDPLYTIDLSDPTTPRKVGELKIPGFSSYIHPLDATHLLTIGTYIPENGAWDTRAVQLAIFDVSNLAQPLQTHVQLVGSASSSSSAQNDHRAFNYFPAKKMLAIPFADWGMNDSTFTSDLRLFKVDANTGFTPAGTLDVRDMVVRDGCDVNHGCWYGWWMPAVRRSVMADDFVYAISTGGIRVADMNSPATPIATALFPYSP